jgi:NAD+-dependent secondary alcohol dehydrogenase Adh1
VVVIGAGGLGHIGIQCLSMMTPAEIIVIDPSEPALALARELGADHTVKVDGSPLEGADRRAGRRGDRRLRRREGRDRGWHRDRSRRRLYYVIGCGENVDIPTIDVISREILFIGNLVGTYTDLQKLMTLTAQGKVNLHTTPIRSSDRRRNGRPRRRSAPGPRNPGSGRRS